MGYLLNQVSFEGTLDTVFHAKVMKSFSAARCNGADHSQSSIFALQTLNRRLTHLSPPEDRVHRVQLLALEQKISSSVQMNSKV